MISKEILSALGNLGKSANYYKAPLFWNQKLGFKNALRVAELWALINEYTPLSTLKTLRMVRLKKLISNAKRQIPFYADLYRSSDIDLSKPFSEEDLKKLPIITKKDLREFANSEYATNIPSWRKREVTTSGSTGEPFHFFLDNAYSAEMVAMGNRIWRWARADVNKTKILCAPESAKRYYPNLIHFPHSSLRSNLRKNLDIIRSSGADLIFGTPVMAFDFLRLFIEAGISIHFEKAILGGHKVTPGIREYLLLNFGCEVFEFYAAAEVRMIGIECEKHTGLHIQEENVVVEIVDENGIPLPPGRVGKIVVTSLSNEIMPFIRYKLGDLGQILSRPCSCRRTSRLIQVQGRTNEPLLLSPNGNSVAPSTLRDILDPFFAYFYRYQLIQKSRTDFLLKIVPTASYTKKVGERATAELKKEIGNASISLEAVAEIFPLSSGKLQNFISSLWKEQFQSDLFVAPELKDEA